MAPAEDPVVIKGLAERALRKHQYATAEELCDKALKALGGSSDVKESERKLRAETLLVRSLARVKLDRLDEAEVDALSAIADAPQLLLGYVRLGVIHTQRGAWNSAARVLRQGEKEFAKSTAVNNPTTVIQKTLDHVAVDGALHGSDDGFDGQILEVRPAGDEPWLGLPAPEEPSKDAPPEHLAPSPASLPGPSGPTSALSASEHAAVSVAWRWLSFRDLHEAVEAAKDGDRIVLLPGTHNTGARGVPVVIAKRVLIMGAGVTRRQ